MSETKEQEQPTPAATLTPWQDADVRILELIAELQARVRRLEDDLARLHEQDDRRTAGMRHMGGQG